MIAGCLILACLQQSNGQVKKRPALVLTVMPPYNDLLICGISSKVRQKVEGFDEVVFENDTDFAASGLKVSSLIRLGMVATIPKSGVLGELGTLPIKRVSRLRNKLADHIRDHLVLPANH